MSDWHESSDFVEGDPNAIYDERTPDEIIESLQKEISALRSQLEAMQCMQIDSESDKWKRIKPVPDKPEV